jgi:beta-mannosidase
LTTGVEDVRDSDAYSTDGILPTTEAPHGYPERGERRRSFVRKPQYSFGWDWIPRVATTAIAGDVIIRAINTGCIRQVNLQAARDGNNEVIVTATVVVDLLHHYKSGEGAITVTLTGPDGKKFKTSQSSFLRSGYNFIRMRIPIKNPLLWWPNGLGEQNLYKVEAKLQIGKDAMEYPAFDYGIRFVGLDTNDKFAVVINGKKVFCKGANWIPADAIYARVSDERYEQLVREARDANFNMLRVWGGGWYERDAFYRACDRHGIMLWHDFMFACAPYPDHLQTFCDEIEKELDYQTRRLSRYACIVLWCGCNENNWGWVDWWKEQTRADRKSVV